MHMLWLALHFSANWLIRYMYFIVMNIVTTLTHTQYYNYHAYSPAKTHFCVLFISVIMSFFSDYMLWFVAMGPHLCSSP